MTIEDLVLCMHTLSVKCNRWDSNVVSSFYDQIHRKSGFTDKQAALALKLVTRYSGQLNTLMGQDIQQYIDNPQYKFIIRSVSNTKSMAIVDYPHYGRSVKVMFPYKDETISLFRKSRPTLDLCSWDADQKAWMFALSETNLLFLIDLAEKDGFVLDAEMQEYAAQITDVVQDFERYVPTLVLEDGVPKLKNVGITVPELNTTSVLEAVFESRKRGICAWDELVNYHLEGSDIDPVTRRFLNSDPGDAFVIDSSTVPMSSLTDIVRQLSPCLFVIPGNNELETTRQAYDFLKDAGFDDNEMSVMFRLPSDRHQEFNEFVRSRNLNSPITDDTKIVFISCKLPKTVIKSNMQFNCIINLGFIIAHYTTKAYVYDHANLINFSKKCAQQELDWLQPA